MGSIRFFPFGYWNSKTMKLEDFPSNENMNEVIDFCQNLTAKYAWDKGCSKHPEIEHVITVYFTDGYKDFQFAKNDSCTCPEMHQRLKEIRDFETVMNNPKHE